MPYTPQTWLNDAAGGTPISAERLTVMEAGIEDADSRITPLEMFWTATDRGLLAQSLPAESAPSNTNPTTAGRLEFAKLKLPLAASVTNVLLHAVVAGVTLTSGQNFAALYTAAGALVAATADQTTAWGSTGVKTMALSGGPYALSAGIYVVGFWYNGTTSPAWSRNGGTTAAFVNVGTTIIWGSANTGLTTTAPSTLGTQNAASSGWWAGLS